MKTLHYLVLLMLSSGIGLRASAQKLPAEQKETVIAPKNVKIDGDASEWQPKAYSNATDFFYTVANDKDNLYVVIQDTTNASVQRIANNGMSFIFKSADKSIKPVTIGYPKILGQFASGISYQLRSKLSLNEEDVIRINKQLNDHLKDMPVSGIPDIQGSAISVYNELGIVAVQHVNDKKVYVIEFKLPLKYLTTVKGTDGTINYRLQVNGVDTSDGTVVMVGHRLGEVANTTNDELIKAKALANTYVDGTYTLAINKN